MERLPFVDEHTITVDADRDRVWRALTAFIRARLGAGMPALATRALALNPAHASGDWSGTELTGNAITGFAVAQAVAGERIVLLGSHRFSTYSLEFTLADDAHGACTLSAVTHARFPGIAGRVYRAIVIGSRGHSLLVGQMLRAIAKAA